MRYTSGPMSLFSPSARGGRARACLLFSLLFLGCGSDGEPCAKDEARTWYPDRNHDGRADPGGEPKLACSQPAGFVSQPAAELSEGCDIEADGYTCVETATCDSDCSAPKCGDGIVNKEAGEECEGGSVADPYGSCAACERNPGWTQSFPREANTDLLLLCATDSDEIYVALYNKIVKLDAEGEVEWEVAPSDIAGIAHIACSAAHGVVAAGSTGTTAASGGMWVRRWSPEGKAAFDRQLAWTGRGTSSVLVVLRADGSLVAVGAANGMVGLQAYSLDGAPLRPMPLFWNANGLPVVLGINGSGVELLVERELGTYDRPNVQVRRYGIAGLNSTGVPVTATMFYSAALVANRYLLLGDQTAIMIGTDSEGGTSTDPSVGVVQHLSSMPAALWTPPLTLARGEQDTPRGIGRSARGTILIGRLSDWRMVLTEIGLDKTVLREWDTKLKQYPHQLAELSDGSVVVGGVATDLKTLIVTRLAFDKLAPAKQLLRNGASCMEGRQCMSEQCLKGVCQAAGSDDGEACTLPENCASNLCVSKVCEPSGLGQGEECKDARQCTSMLCAQSRCG